MDIGKLEEYLAYTVKKFYYDPVGLTIELFGVEPTWQQTEIMNAVVKYKKVSVRSGHNIGKSALATWLNWWFLLTRSYPKIICSANTKQQLYDVLWTEMAKWMRHSDVISSLFEWNKEKVFAKWSPNEWWAVARTASEGEGIQGRHADNQLLIFDEVSGMADNILEATEGLMSGKNVYVLLISNPTRDSGFFYDTQMKPELASYWHPMQYSSLDSPLLSQEWLDYMKAKYGENSPVYMVRVLGEFPFDSQDCLIPREWIMNAVDKPMRVENWMPRIISVDVGAGGDKSVILHRVGSVIEKITRYNISDTMELASIALGDYRETNADAICVDSIGIGKGMYDWLKKKRVEVHPVDVRRRSYRKGFSSLRDELWWKTREQFELGNISIPNDYDLQLELWSAKYFPKEGEKIKVQSKADMRKKPPIGMGKSPDSADALMMSYFVNDLDYVHAHNKGKKDFDDEDFDNDNRENRYVGRSEVSGY